MAAASNFFKNPNTQSSPRPASRIQKNPSKSCSSWVFKSLVVLLVIPLFPSQAPDFIYQNTIFTKFWELLQLLFTGIAVSYGLFCRRSVKVETESENHSSGFDNNTSHSNYYLSGISNVSSFFQDGFENLGGISDENRILHNRDSQYLYKDSIFKGSSGSEDGKKIRSLTLRNGLGSNSKFDKENVSQLWNSQYFQGESLVVVTDGNYDLEEHKPLGLPIRSLRSRVSGAEKLEFANRTLANSSLKRSFENDSEGRVEKIRGVRSTNLQNKFEEAVGHSIILQKSRSGRMEIREEVGNAEPPGHSRPHSIGEFEFKPLKSRSFRQPASSSDSSKSLGSRMSSSSSSVSQEPSNLKTGNVEQKKDLEVACDSTSHSAVGNGNNGISFTSTKERGFSIASSSELDMQKRFEDDPEDSMISDAKPSNLKPGNMEQKKDLNAASDSILHSSIANVNNGLSFTSTKDRGFSITGCFSELDMEKSPEDDSKDFGRGTKRHLLGRGKSSSDSMSSDAKTSNLSTILSRAKSVRTIRSGRYVSDKMKRIEKYSNRIVDDVDQLAAPKETEVHPLMSSTSPEHQNREKQELIDSDLASEESSESENDQDSSDENDEVNDDDNDNDDLAGSEVDRKADEFIAKFREQIRLQKISSASKKA